MKVEEMTRFQREEDRVGQTSVCHLQSHTLLSARIALFALRFYKTYLSILFAGNCRFTPSCSQYAYEAIERFGLARGTWLGLKRLLRCHPLSRKFGYDPVPENFDETPPPRKRASAATGVSRSIEIPHEVHS